MIFGMTFKVVIIEVNKLIIRSDRQYKKPLHIHCQYNIMSCSFLVDNLIKCLLLFRDTKKGNVANQREHLILLLANMNIRDWAESSYQVNYYFLQKSRASRFFFFFFLYLMDKVMLNFSVVLTLPLIILKANKNLVAAP